jgi:hypothetical protein
MKNSIHAAFFKPPFLGGTNLDGRLVIRANACVKSPFSSRPKMLGKKGVLNPHGYSLHAALSNTTSSRTFRLLGRHASGRMGIKKSPPPAKYQRKTRLKPSQGAA